MPLGIYTKYRHCEATVAALRLANWAEGVGHIVSLFSATEHPVQLSSRWDREVAANRGRRYTDWAVENTTVIWTHCPIPEQILWAKKKGIRTGLLCLWNELREADYKAYEAADFILAPSQIAGQYVTQALKVGATCIIPWDTGYPLTKKDPRVFNGYVSVLLPLFDYEPYDIEATALEVVGRGLHRFPCMSLTVVYNASKTAPFAISRIRQFRRYFGERVQLGSSIPLCDRPMVFASHDLTFWPVCRGNTGMTGLTSLTMGTPVLAFQMPPFDEFLTASNSFLVSSDICRGDLGIPRLEPDYNAMEQGLYDALDHPERLQALQQNVLSGLLHRRKGFEGALTQVIS